MALIIGFVWIVICTVIPVLYFVPGMEAYRFQFSLYMQIIAPFLSALICMTTRSAFPRGDKMRTVWTLLALAVLSWGIGAVFFALYPIMNDGAETPYPYYSDIGYLGLIPFAIAALMVLKSTLRIAVPVWGWIAAVIFGGAALLWSVWLLGYSYAEADSLMTYFVDWVYIVFDPLLLTIAVITASVLAGGQTAWAWWFVLLGILIYFIGDVLYVYLTVQETYSTGHWIDCSWPLAFGLIAVAALMTKEIFMEKTPIIDADSDLEFIT